MAYVRGDTQTSSIHLIDPTTDNDREIVHGDLFWSPIWISDNEFIFQHGIEQGGADVPSTTGAYRLIVPQSDSVDWTAGSLVVSPRDFISSSGTPFGHFGQATRVQSFDVHNDARGLWIAVQVCDDVPSEACGVYRVDLAPDWNSITPIVALTSGRVSGFPAISPDGTRVAVQTYYYDTKQESPIEIWGLDGSLAKTLPDTLLSGSAYWGQDGMDPGRHVAGHRAPRLCVR